MREKCITVMAMETEKNMLSVCTTQVETVGFLWHAIQEAREGQ